MNLTPAQLLTLKAAIAAETDPTFVANRNAGATGAMSSFYNEDSAFVVWRTTTTVDSIMNAIAWANLTPTDTPDGTQTWMNRALACQGKQFNLQTILTGRTQIASANATIRNGIQDALTAIPSGAGGATVGGGWNNVQAVLQRAARRGEALYATGTGTAQSPGALVAEGTITNENVVQALGS